MKIRKNVRIIFEEIRYVLFLYMGKREEVNAKVTKITPEYGNFFLNAKSKGNFFDMYCKTKKKTKRKNFT